MNLFSAMDTHLLLSSLNVTIDGNIPVLILCAIVLIVLMFSDLTQLLLGGIILLVVELISSVISFVSLFKRR